MRTAQIFQKITLSETPRSLLFGILIKIVAFKYYLTGEQTIFVKHRDVGIGVLYVRISAHQVNGTPTKRATGSGHLAEAVAYSLKV